MKRPILIGTFLAVLVCLVVAGTKISRLTRTTDIQPDSIFLVVTGSTVLGNTETRGIEATNLLSELFLLPNWVAPPSAQSIKTNGTAINIAATSLDFITGSNTTIRATNTAGAVTVQINSSASGGAGATTNANQFGATTDGNLTLKEGVQTTNALQYGITTNAGSGTRIRGNANPFLEITSITLPQTLKLNSQGIGTASGGGQPYVLISPEDTPTIEIPTDSIRPANAVLADVGTQSRPFQNSYFAHWVSSSNFFLGAPSSAAVKLLHGNASPEGVVSAPPQSLWFQTNQTSGIGIWIKTNGYGSAGWWLLTPGSGGGGGLSDGDKGDVTVGSSGTDWQLDAAVVSFVELLDATATQRIIGRNTAGSGDFEEITGSTMLNWFGNTQGDILYRNATGWTNLGAGSAGQFLSTPGPGGNPSWVTPGTLSDGDKTDITVSGTGSIWIIDDSAVSSNKIAASAVDSSKILDGTISGSDIPSGILLTNIDVMNLTNRGVSTFTGVATFNAAVTNNDRVWLNERINQVDPANAATFGQLRAQTLLITNEITRPRNVPNLNAGGEFLWQSGKVYATNLAGNFFIVPTNLTSDVMYYVQITSAGFVTTVSNSANLVVRGNPATGGTFPGISTNGTTDLFIWKDNVTGFTNCLIQGPQYGVVGDQNVVFTTNNLTLTITASVPPVVTNVANVKFAIQQPAITASNLVLNLDTNNFQCIGLTNIILTNWSALTFGVNGKVKVAIENTIGVSVPIVWPAFGSQHGLYKFHTNGLNDVLSATVAPPGTNTIASFEVDGTNIYGSVTYWKR